MAFAIGISIDIFRHLTPTELEYCLKGYKMKQRAHDIETWEAIVNYVIPAIKIGVRAGAWGKGKVDFPQEPAKISEEIQSEKTLQERRDAFVAKMRTMKTNWDINHGNNW